MFQLNRFSARNRLNRLNRFRTGSELVQLNRFSRYGSHLEEVYGQTNGSLALAITMPTH